MNGLAKQMDELFSRELALGGRTAVNYAALQKVEHRAMPVDGLDAVLFFNPGRVASVMAKVDEETLRHRPCFLCPDGLGADQLTLDWHAPAGNDYWIRVNPFPIFDRHFTISIARHERQQMTGHFADMLALAQAAPFTPPPSRISPSWSRTHPTCSSPVRLSLRASQERT